MIKSARDQMKTMLLSQLRLLETPHPLKPVILAMKIPPPARRYGSSQQTLEDMKHSLIMVASLTQKDTHFTQIVPPYLSSYQMSQSRILAVLDSQKPLVSSKIRMRPGRPLVFIALEFYAATSLNAVGAGHHQLHMVEFRDILISVFPFLFFLLFYLFDSLIFTG
jgi:hypothetical protein